MFISQDRNQFYSLKEAQKGIDESGGRVAICQSDQVVTINPQVVKNFPGTIKELFDVGRVLGMYPIEVYKQIKSDCELRDHAKELVYTRAIGHMVFLSEQRAIKLLDDLLCFVRSLIEANNLQTSIPLHNSVMDFLLSFRMKVEDRKNLVSITALQACEEYLEQLIIQSIGVALIHYLRSSSPDELQICISDPYSVFNVDIGGNLESEELYKLLLHHPGILSHHEQIKNKIRNDVYYANPLEVFTDSNSTLIEEPKPIIHVEPWNTKDIFNVFSKEQIYTILNTYFSIMNPIQVIQELTTLRSMARLFLKEHREAFEKENIEQLEELVQKINQLREFEHIFQANPQLAQTHYLKQDNDGHLEVSNTNVSEFEDDWLEDHVDSKWAKEWFNDTLLERRDLTWEEKGVLSFVYFVGAGSLNFDKMMKYSHTPRSALRKTVDRLESEGVLISCEECGAYHLKSISELDWHIGKSLLCQLPIESFKGFIKDDELSWDAKGIYTWIQCSGNKHYDIKQLTSLSNNPPLLVEQAYYELIDQGYLVQVENIDQQLKNDVHSCKKENILKWYEEELKPALQKLLTLPGDLSNILNAKYPAGCDFTAIQVASISDDVEMVGALLQINELILHDSDDLHQHPLLLALYCGNHAAAEKLLEDQRVVNQSEIINIFFGNAIMEEIPPHQLSSYLSKLRIPDKKQVVSKLLLPALMRLNRDVIRELLKAGASPYIEIVNKKTAMDIAKDREEVDIIMLFKEYT